MDTHEKSAVRSAPVSVTEREKALEAALTAHQLVPTGAIERLIEYAET